MVKFFTLPPDRMDYPYILINANHPENGLRYVASHRSSIEAVIIDSGIEIFRNPSIKEYPGGAEAWIKRLVDLYDRAKKIVPHARVYVTCPDYCDDYHPKSLWLSDDLTNIERTILNILMCVDWYSDVDWLIPVQGWNRKPESLMISLDYLHQLGVLKNRRYIAIANLCVEPSTEIVRKSVLYVRHWLKIYGYSDTDIHVFGLKIAALHSIKNMITSFDSTAWTRPVSTRLHRVFPWSAKTDEERMLFFIEYLIRLKRIGVEIPQQTIEEAKRWLDPIKKGLIRRYPTKIRLIEKLIRELRKELETGKKVS